MNQLLIDHTVVIGAGGTGGYLVPQLARLLAYHPQSSDAVQLWDGDEFEERNRERQICGEAQVGLNKATALASLCAAVGLSSVQPRENFITADGMRVATKDYQRPLVVLAVDNDATRQATLRAMERRIQDGLDFFWISPGNCDNADGQGRIRADVTWWGMVQGTQLGIDPRELYQNIANPDDSIPREGSCALHAPSAPQLLSANALAATGALLVIQALLDLQLPAQASAMSIDGRSFSMVFS